MKSKWKVAAVSMLALLQGGCDPPTYPQMEGFVIEKDFEATSDEGIWGERRPMLIACNPDSTSGPNELCKETGLDVMMPLRILSIDGELCETRTMILARSLQLTKKEIREAVRIGKRIRSADAIVCSPGVKEPTLKNLENSYRSEDLW